MVKTTLDIGETAPARATEVTREFRSSSLGVLLSVFAVAAGALLVELFRSDSWSTPVRAVVTVSGSLAVVIVLDRGRWLWELISAIRHQRDKARERLMEIKEASLKYKVVPTGADTAPRNEDALLRVLIENRGRGARFAVVIERISGTEEPLLDSFSPLYWMGRKGVLDEEIPPGEGRLIGVGYISPRDNTYWFTPPLPRQQAV